MFILIGSKSHTLVGTLVFSHSRHGKAIEKYFDPCYDSFIFLEIKFGTLFSLLKFGTPLPHRFALVWGSRKLYVLHGLCLLFFHTPVDVNK